MLLVKLVDLCQFMQRSITAKRQCFQNNFTHLFVPVAVSDSNSNNRQQSLLFLAKRTSMPTLVVSTCCVFIVVETLGL